MRVMERGFEAALFDMRRYYGNAPGQRVNFIREKSFRYGLFKNRVKVIRRGRPTVRHLTKRKMKIAVTSSTGALNPSISGQRRQTPV